MTTFVPAVKVYLQTIRFEHETLKEEGRAEEHEKLAY